MLCFLSFLLRPFQGGHVGNIRAFFICCRSYKTFRTQKGIPWSLPLVPKVPFEDSLQKINGKISRTVPFMDHLLHSPPQHLDPKNALKWRQRQRRRGVIDCEQAIDHTHTHTHTYPQRHDGDLQIPTARRPSYLSHLSLFEVPIFLSLRLSLIFPFFGSRLFIFPFLVSILLLLNCSIYDFLRGSLLSE